MNVLIIAPHPDDEAIGCGGAICRHVARRDSVHAVFLTSGELGLKEKPRDEAWRIREDEARKSAKVLKLSSVHFLRCPDWMMGENVPDVSAKLAALLPATAPELIYLPHPLEWHPDHKACLPAIHGALKNTGDCKATLRGYEVWTPMPEYQHVENITDVMPLKLRALRKHKSQIESWDYVRAVRALNEFRGVMAGRCRFAEVFVDLPVA